MARRFFEKTLCKTKSHFSSEKPYEYESLSPTPFELREGNRITLFQDAHCEGNYPPPIITDSGEIDQEYTPPNCFESIYKAILNAKRFVYIVGWAVDTRLLLLRRRKIYADEPTEKEQEENGSMTIAELLALKAKQGLRVLVHIWDEKLSVSVGHVRVLQGIMDTLDEETKKVCASIPGVECTSSYRNGKKKKQLFWTHHQKSVIVDADPAPDSFYSLIELPKTEYKSFKDDIMTPERKKDLESRYGRPDILGNRYTCASFMTCEHTFTRIFNTKEADLSSPLSIFRAVPPEGWYALGDLAQRINDTIPDATTLFLIVKEPPHIDGFAPLLAPPQRYVQVWPKEEGEAFEANDESLVLWEPIAPEGYYSLGYVATTTTDQPSVDLIRCVHEDAVLPAFALYEQDDICIWRNKGHLGKTNTGGGRFSIWSIKPESDGVIAGTFCVRERHRLHEGESNSYWCLRHPVAGIPLCPKPTTSDVPEKQAILLPQVQQDVGRRRVVAFMGGQDITGGRWDTPAHPLYRSLHTDHVIDFKHAWSLKRKYGPREPWHDIHSFVEGPAARDILINFEQRWRKQGTKLLSHLGPEFISVKEEQIMTSDSWNSRVCRSIDRFSADIPDYENGIQHAYVTAIRKAKRFIYIENQYFRGSAQHWLKDQFVECYNLIPYELAKKVCDCIMDDKPFMIYIALPMYPHGWPGSGSVQEQLRWQWNTMTMMYTMIAEALSKKNITDKHPRDYLMFFCLGQRESLPCTATAVDEPTKKFKREFLLFHTRRFPIYIHSKLMVIDDEYIILGSANINERSMAGDRDTEICIENWQPAFIDQEDPRGAIHKFRMSLWAEHTNQSLVEFLRPNTFECSRKVQEIADRNWEIFAGESVIDMEAHLMRYPITVNKDGSLDANPEMFVDTEAPVRGKTSLLIVDSLTT